MSLEKKVPDQRLCTVMSQVLQTVDLERDSERGKGEGWRKGEGGGGDIARLAVGPPILVLLFLSTDGEGYIHT